MTYVAVRDMCVKLSSDVNDLPICKGWLKVKISTSSFYGAIKRPCGSLKCHHPCANDAN